MLLRKFSSEPTTAIRRERLISSYLTCLARFLHSFRAPALRGEPQVRIALLGAELDMAQQGHGNHVIVVGELDSAHAGRGPPGEDANVADGKADALPGPSAEEDVLGLGASAHPHQRVARRELHGDLAGCPDAGEIRKPVAADVNHPRLRGVAGQHDAAVVAQATRARPRVHDRVVPNEHRIAVLDVDGALDAREVQPDTAKTKAAL